MYCCLSIISGTKLIKKIVTPHKARFFFSLYIKNVCAFSVFLSFRKYVNTFKNVRLFGDESIYGIDTQCRHNKGIFWAK